MALSLAERIEKLSAQIQPIAAEDEMPEAARKVLLAELVRVFKHEEGSRTGEDIEDVHDMRVATRRIRSIFRLLGPYFKQSAIRPYTDELRRLARALGEVRDLDVLIEDISAFQAALKANKRTDLQPALDALDQQRQLARQALIEVLDSRAYRRFVKDFSKFLTSSGEGVKSPDGVGVVPSQVRHVLPGMIHQRLAAVLAYDVVIHEADAVTLHALRIEFKRLRYAISLFDDVLGTTISDFISVVKDVQDCLGHMNDAATARLKLHSLLDEALIESLAGYIKSLDEKETEARANFDQLWTNFNSRKIQQKLSNALLSLR